MERTNRTGVGATKRRRVKGVEELKVEKCVGAKGISDLRFRNGPFAPVRITPLRRVKSA